MNFRLKSKLLIGPTSQYYILEIYFSVSFFPLVVHSYQVQILSEVPAGVYCNFCQFPLFLLQTLFEDFWHSSLEAFTTKFISPFTLDSPPQLPLVLLSLVNVQFFSPVDLLTWKKKDFDAYALVLRFLLHYVLFQQSSILLNTISPHLWLYIAIYSEERLQMSEVQLCLRLPTEHLTSAFSGRFSEYVAMFNQLRLWRAMPMNFFCDVDLLTVCFTASFCLLFRMLIIVCIFRRLILLSSRIFFERMVKCS